MKEEMEGLKAAIILLEKVVTQLAPQNCRINTTKVPVRKAFLVFFLKFKASTVSSYWLDC
jgi:hypothetical protein